MKFFSAALQGSVLFVTLLLTQVVIVTSLALTALWLYFKRLQKGEEFDDSDVADSEGKSLGVSKEFLSGLQQKLVALEKEKADYLQSDAVKDLAAEKLKTDELQKLNQQTAEKIQSLEMKLLEYEVLKDEIGQLTQFKTENQNLKSEIETLKKEQGETVIKAVENIQPQPEPQSQEAAVPQPVNAVVEVKEDSQKANTSELSVAAESDPGLEGLLNEIEALTTEKKNQIKKAS